MSKKRIAAVAMSLVLAMTATSCEKKNDNVVKGGNDTSAVVSTAVIKESTEGPSEANDSKLLSGTYKVPAENIYVDVPQMKEIESGYSVVFLDLDEKYLTFPCMPESSATDCNDALEQTVNLFKANIRNYHRVNELGEVTKENVTVSGIEACKIEGSVSAGRDPVYDAYFYGYAFVYNGLPCAIYGSVINEGQPEQAKEIVKEYADAMMQTVRSEP